VLNVTGLLKRLVIGRAKRSEELHETLLPKRLALPIFASDPLSSVAYATQEILLVLSLGGLAYLHFTPWIAAAVVILLTVVVLSYRQVVSTYPSGGGSYEVVSTNLGPSAGLVVAASLLVDYVMTVAVSVASGVGRDTRDHVGPGRVNAVGNRRGAIRLIEVAAYVSRQWPGRHQEYVRR
jgi:hypothetical protein